MNLKKVFSKFQKLSKSPNFNKFDNFSKYTRRQTIARFLARYEIFKKQIDIDADLWLIEIVSKEVDLTDLFLKQGL